MQQSVQLNPRTRVKVCGITRPEDALAVARAGADAIGLVFFAASPRAVSVARAQEILAALPPYVTRVGLFVNADAITVNEVLASVPLDILQFHGDESPHYCHAFTRPWVKALRMKPGLDLQQSIAQYSGAHGILLDAWHAEKYGGTGTAFDWSSLSLHGDGPRIILAGGLQPANVAAAIRQVGPWAVDVSSGVESSPGIKSAELVQQFISEVQRV